MASRAILSSKSAISITAAFFFLLSRLTSFFAAFIFLVDDFFISSNSYGLQYYFTWVGICISRACYTPVIVRQLIGFRHIVDVAGKTGDVILDLDFVSRNSTQQTRLIATCSRCKSSDYLQKSVQ